MKRAIAIVSVFLLSGCQTMDGQYTPSCIAFEGDSIEFQDGQFVWTRFTDEVHVDSEGNKVLSSTGYPKSGTYEVSGTQVELHADGDDEMVTYYRLSLDGEHYLLTAAEQGRYTMDGIVARCALRRNPDPE